MRRLGDLMALIDLLFGVCENGECRYQITSLQVIVADLKKFYLHFCYFELCEMNFLSRRKNA